MRKSKVVALVLAVASPAYAGEVDSQCTEAYTALLLQNINMFCTEVELTDEGDRLLDQFYPEVTHSIECSTAAHETIAKEMLERGAQVDARGLVTKWNTATFNYETVRDCKASLDFLRAVQQANPQSPISGGLARGEPRPLGDVPGAVVTRLS